MEVIFSLGILFGAMLGAFGILSLETLLPDVFETLANYFRSLFKK